MIGIPEENQLVTLVICLIFISPKLKGTNAALTLRLFATTLEFCVNVVFHEVNNSLISPGGMSFSLSYLHALRTALLTHIYMFKKTKPG